MKYISTIIILILIISIYALAELSEVKVTGTGIIQSDDIVKARNEAFGKVVNNAVREGVKSIISQQMISENSKLLEEKIYSRAGGYIKSIEIIDEKINPKLPNSYEVTAKAAIISNDLQNDLINIGLADKAIINDNAPVILAFIQEKNIDNVHWHFQIQTYNYAENTISDVIRLKGFKFVKQANLMQDITPDIERAFYSDDINTILNMGKTTGADVVITGKAISRASWNNGNALIQASIHMKAIQVDNGKMIASSSGVSELVHNDELIGGSLAIEEAANMATLQLISDLTGSQTQNVFTGNKVTLVVNGLKSIEDLIQFRHEFEDRTDLLKSIDQRTFSGGTAAYDLVSGSDGKAIAAELISKGLESFNVEIRAQSPDYLELNLKLK